jgi:hypothetical protein
METKILFLDSKDPEFNYAFSHFEDPVMHNKQYGEVLQYMGTVFYPEGIKHEFRHRAIPGTNERKYWKIPASPAFNGKVKKGLVDLSKAF